MITPRPYISFHQLTTFEMSVEEYRKQYLLGMKTRVNYNMHYGAKMASGLKDEEATGDPLLDLVMGQLPRFERMDKPVVGGKNSVMVWYERDKKNYLIPMIVYKEGRISHNIPILAIPDTATESFRKFKEYKTSLRQWTQKMADESGQITFYCTAMYLATDRIPIDIELINVPLTQDPETHKLQPTGEIVRLRTQRSMIDIIKMITRIKNAWFGIQRLCEKELI